MSDTLDTIIAEMRWIASRCGTLPDGDPYARPDSRDLREWADRLAALQREPAVPAITRESLLEALGNGYENEYTWSEGEIIAALHKHGIEVKG